jgi:hypothetical protein
MNVESFGTGGGATPATHLSRRLVVTVALVVVIGGALAGLVIAHRHRSSTTPVVVAGPRFQGSYVHAPAGVRIKVEVLNATRLRGLGRRATLYLRDRGFDVVAFGTSPATRDTTLVIDRSGHPAYAQLVAQGLGGARVESHPDTSRYVDVSVLVGAGWRPPAQPFYP